MQMLLGKKYIAGIREGSPTQKMIRFNLWLLWLQFTSVNPVKGHEAPWVTDPLLNYDIRCCVEHVLLFFCVFVSVLFHISP